MLTRRQFTKLLPLAAAAPVLGADKSTGLHVLSFNLRYPNWDDKEHHWIFRKEIVGRVINAQKYDVVGVQEALRSQLDNLKPHLGDFIEIGVGRDDGKTAGEYSALLLRKTSFEVTESGTFWLSDTPEKPGSMTWNNKCPRVCTWAKVRWQRAGGAKELFLVNTHWDNASELARKNSATLMTERLPKLAGGLPWLLTGDFNCTAASAEYKALLKGTGLADTYAEANPKAELKASGTMHGFSGRKDGARIDHVLTSDAWRTDTVEILHTKEALWPSDHFPVRWAGDLK